jgi:hypothetical protein
MTKRKFSSFKEADAFRELGIKKLQAWQTDFPPLLPSDFFGERLRRLENFGLRGSERAKELLIDAVFEEVLEHHQKLRAWKAAPLESDSLTGVVDYLIATRIDYIETPFVCVAEAKNDDFEKGLAQCLVEMQACRWQNEQANRKIDVYGVVTNGGSWVFYKMDTDKRVWASLPYAISSMENILGTLNYIFTQCESNL